ncbi:helix-turn-helix transcriptional regulator [Pseudonocardia sp. RS11V-5]|uniref:helix-turn-helix domain-containing protein n=1 Tax=Pseudonocardia terrae TaxID=2905831 RepID=UPI001E334441|nr:helix-turn-helix transcriptional regulator [Pseudonocardia terrae]MCE3551298.1 helix-turn-helix transcriptional regulator [Pseudonocardia terrae]
MPDTSTDQGRDTPQRFCADFARELSGRGVSVRDAADRSGWSKSAIGNARTGPRLPRRELVVDVLSAIGLDAPALQDWTLRHAALSMIDPDEPAPVVDPALPPATPARSRRSPLLVAGVSVLVGAIVAGLVVYVVVRPGPPAPPLAVASAVVTVQNKIALGAADLVEDTSPAYLSARPQPYCAREGCKLDGTDLTSGALLPATCTVHGAEMWNYNLDSPAVANPARARSDLWYRLSWPDGRSGYLSEVYLEAGSRGGLGLPACS